MSASPNKTGKRSGSARTTPEKALKRAAIAPSVQTTIEDELAALEELAMAPEAPQDTLYILFQDTYSMKGIQTAGTTLAQILRGEMPCLTQCKAPGDDCVNCNYSTQDVVPCTIKSVPDAIDDENFKSGNLLAAYEELERVGQ